MTNNLKDVFYILVAFVFIVTYAYAVYQEPTEMQIEFLTRSSEFISNTENTETFNVFAEFKNIGASGTLVIELKCYGDNEILYYNEKQVFDLEKNQRGNMSNIITTPKSENLTLLCDFEIPKTVKNTQSIKPLTLQLLTP